LERRRGGSESVRFTGWKQNTADYLRASDIFILPSLGEGLPNSLLEAMACGLTCMSTRIGGISELITDGKNGLLIEPGSVSAVFEGLHRAASDPGAAAAMGKEARKRMMAGFSIENIAKKYTELYSRVLTMTKT
jgi:glycosyltransferase involved in cell wall biosynthesis